MAIYLILLISSLLSAVYGLCRHIGKKVPLFAILITAALGCFMMEHLCEVLSILVSSEIPDKFNIGMLARVGGFAFLFSASYAQMDGLVDDNDRKLWKYRLIAMAAPYLILAFYLPVLLSDLPLVKKIMEAVLLLFIALPSYYHLKHLIVPDVHLGIVGSIRAYNAFALILDLSCAAFMIADRLNLQVIVIISGILLAAVYPCTWISMEKGRKKWMK